MARGGLGGDGLRVVFSGVWLIGGERSMWVPHLCHCLLQI